nr:MAG TPA: hypothetical protein [Caudoviricetes sp.]
MVLRYLIFLLLLYLRTHHQVLLIFHYIFLLNFLLQLP